MLDVWRALNLPLSSDRQRRAVIEDQATLQIGASP
jgi:hypothetical protein